MTRDQAHDRIDSGTLTWGDLKTLLRNDMGERGYVSVVNKSMTHGHAMAILLAAVEPLDDAGIVAGPKSLMPHRDRLTATNVLRECS